MNSLVNRNWTLSEVSICLIGSSKQNDCNKISDHIWLFNQSFVIEISENDCVHDQKMSLILVQ